MSEPRASHAADFLTAQQASQLGLVEAWRRQTEVPVGAKSIVDQQLFVHAENPHEYVEVVAIEKQPAPANEKAEADAPNPPAPVAADAENASANVIVRIPTDRVDAHGNAIGKAEAERLARNELRRLKRRGIEGKIETRIVSRVRLYTLGNDGTLECRDAETGEPVWMVRVGTERLGYKAIGVGEHFVTVINGGNLIKIDALNGEMIQSVRTVNIPTLGAINTGDFAVIATIQNGIEGYPLFDPSRLPFRERVAGRALALPTKVPGSTRIAWGTDQGFVYCMESEGEPSVMFRLNTDGVINGRIASASGGRFFFGSDRGQVYGLEATRTGKVLWSRPYGEPFYDEPLIAGEQLLIRTTYGSLYSLSLADGISTWQDFAPNVDKVVGAIDGKIYVTTLSGGFAALDLKTGKPLEMFSGIRPEVLIRNIMTDRMYLVGRTGTVQCLRGIDADLPTIREGYGVSTAAPEKKDEKKKETKPTEPADFGVPAGNDPFAAPGADPFAAPGADPFAAPGGADPFGGDPFGGM
ncbi:outer membrane protein assembly factor BamB family protein [Novipirellula galeiformis]|uniref:outer membrane protein assembly factor BamB family protein n=1 Tax=Novipirellula galeiformis TaxID=2528004 RepID=UPI0018CF5929|nr:PQQ-binding-like beta-propeller repeat protein [Novipirellula galeiformis]